MLCYMAIFCLIFYTYYETQIILTILKKIIRIEKQKTTKNTHVQNEIVFHGAVEHSSSRQLLHSIVSCGTNFSSVLPGNALALLVLQMTIGDGNQVAYFLPICLPANIRKHDRVIKCQLIKFEKRKRNVFYSIFIQFI